MTLGEALSLILKYSSEDTFAMTHAVYSIDVDYDTVTINYPHGSVELTKDTKS